MSSSGKPILIASDHAGIALKAELIKSLSEWTWLDLGPMNTQAVDYPDYASLVGNRIRSGEATRGILICGSGIGMSIAANKITGIRAALVENPVSARLAREHNDSNILCLGSRFIAPEYGVEIARIWLSTAFSEKPSHQERIRKIKILESNPSS